MSNASAGQVAICARFQSEIDAPLPMERVGIATATLGRLPLNALRHDREGSVCGWYIWGGEELPDDPEFFQALCVEHLPDHVSTLVPYLALSPGWRVLLAPGYEDVWFDKTLLTCDHLGVDETVSRPWAE